MNARVARWGNSTVNELDERAKLAAEAFARQLDRRRFLKRSSQAIFSLLAAVVLGSPARDALAAVGCACSYPNGTSCGSRGYSCPQTPWGGCPTGCSVCTSAGNCSPCIYSAGHWSSCGCGPGGYGCRECYDCICPSGAGCSKACGCQGSCRCCNCLTPQDVVTELSRVSTSR